MSQLRLCQNCGKEVLPDESFCGSCGAPVSGVGPAEPPIASVPQPKSHKLRNAVAVVVVALLLLAVAGTLAQTPAGTQGTTGANYSNHPVELVLKSANISSFAKGSAVLNLTWYNETNQTVSFSIAYPDTNTLSLTYDSGGVAGSAVVQARSFVWDMNLTGHWAMYAWTTYNFTIPSQATPVKLTGEVYAIDPAGGYMISNLSPFTATFPSQPSSSTSSNQGAGSQPTLGGPFCYYCGN